MTSVAHSSTRSAHGLRPASVLRALVLLLAALVASGVTWSLGKPVPFAGVDGSWGAALHLAAREGLDFGDEVLFTYGPLGFLDVTRLWGSSTGAAALAFTWAQVTTLILVVSLVLRPVVGLIAGFVIAVVLAALCPPPALAALGFALSVALLARPFRGRQALVAAVALGAIAAVAAMIKLNTGVAVLGVALLAVTAHPDRRRLLPAHVVTLVLGYLLLWLATGQSLGSLPDYLSGSASIISGYSEAMGSDDPGLRWQYLLAAAVLVTGAVGVVSVSRTRGRAERAGLLAMWALFAFLAFKSGFVRHDAGHVRVFSSTVAVALAALPWKPSQRLVPGVVVALALVTALLGWKGSTFAIGSRPGDGWATAKAIVLPSERTEVEDVAAFGVAIGAGVDGALLQRAARMRSVAVWPTESSLSWVADLPFDPLPVFQDYQAYTQDLDGRNAAALADDADAPEGVLLSDRSSQIVDGRPTAFNTPRTTRELLCRYGPVAGSPGWTLLRRISNRCERPPRPLGSITAAQGEAVAVPAPSSPDAVVTVAVDDVAVTGLERVRSALLRAETRALILDGRQGRLTPGTAASGAPIRAGARADFPTRLATGARTIAVRVGDGGDAPVRYRFAEQVLRPMRR